MDNWDEAIKKAYEEQYSPPPDIVRHALETAANAKTIRNVRLLSLCTIFLTAIMVLGVFAIAGANPLFFVGIVSLVIAVCNCIVVAILCPQLVNEHARR